MFLKSAILPGHAESHYVEQRWRV